MGRMPAPWVYIKEFESKEYSDLIVEREKLLKFIKRFEEKEKEGDRSEREWNMDPHAEVRYQMYIWYLAELCELMYKKYNSDYVHGKRSLFEDYNRNNSIPSVSDSKVRKPAELSACDRC